MNKTQMRLLRNRQYNAEREAMSDWLKQDLNYDNLITQIFQERVSTIQTEIDNFYLKYANRNGVSRNTARQRADSMDVRNYFNKAAKAVKEKDFSPEANVWLQVYNLKMNTSRLELMKANVNLELLKMYSETNALITKELEKEVRLERERQERLISEYKEQAGIHAHSVVSPIDDVKGIINSDFYGANFSERLWGRNGHYDEIRKEVFKSLNHLDTDMSGYRKQRDRLAKKFNTSSYEAMRLIRTESQRVNMTVQKEMLEANEFTHYIWVAESGACSICASLSSTAIAISESRVGVSMPPVHPNCKCSILGHIVMEYKTGGTTLDGYEIVDNFDEWVKET